VFTKKIHAVNTFYFSDLNLNGNRSQPINISIEIAITRRRRGKQNIFFAFGPIGMIVEVIEVTLRNMGLVWRNCGIKAIFDGNLLGFFPVL
jgi:hypothetical protein